VTLFSKPNIEPIVKKVELFDSLDVMWLNNWEKLSATNDLKWLVKNEEERELVIDNTLLDAKFLELMDEWFELTNQNSNRKELYAVMKKLILARNKVVQGDMFQMNFVRKFEQTIKDLTEDNKGGDPNKQRMQLSLIAKRDIDKHRITVVDYIKLIEVITEQQSVNNGE
jgi:hypothetical protein